MTDLFDPLDLKKYIIEYKGNWLIVVNAADLRSAQLIEAERIAKLERRSVSEVLLDLKGREATPEDEAWIKQNLNFSYTKRP